YDIYPFLLPELGTSSSGGDAADLARRTSPVPSRRVKLVAKWSGLLTADASGVVRYKVRVPQFSGALRVMAVAYKDDAFASAEHTMRVADPVVISTALPRFASPGDTIDVPVTLTNTTGNLISVSVSLKHNSLLKIAEPISHYVANKSTGEVIKWTPDTTATPANLKSNSENRISFRLIAKTIGNSNVKVIVTNLKGSSEKFTETIELPIRPAAPLATRTGSGSRTATEQDDAPSCGGSGAAAAAGAPPPHVPYMGGATYTRFWGPSRGWYIGRPYYHTYYNPSDDVYFMLNRLHTRYPNTYAATQVEQFMRDPRAFTRAEPSTFLTPIPRAPSSSRSSFGGGSSRGGRQEGRR
ncbi:MAG: hypothetical protein EOO62_38430, partial [Hymenobacter sp.]